MDSPHPLGRAIERWRQTGDKRWSYREVAERANALGYDLSPSNAHRMTVVVPTQVSRDQIELIATVFGVGRAEVARLFLESMGYADALAKAPDVVDAIRADGRLSGEDRELLVNIVEFMHDRFNDQHEADSLPGVEPGEVPDTPPDSETVIRGPYYAPHGVQQGAPEEEPPGEDRTRGSFGDAHVNGDSKI